MNIIILRKAVQIQLDRLERNIAFNLSIKAWNDYDANQFSIDLAVYNKYESHFDTLKLSFEVTYKVTSQKPFLKELAKTIDNILNNK